MFEFDESGNESAEKTFDTSVIDCMSEEEVNNTVGNV